MKNKLFEVRSKKLLSSNNLYKQILGVLLSHGILLTIVVLFIIVPLLVWGISVAYKSLNYWEMEYDIPNDLWPCPWYFFGFLFFVVTLFIFTCLRLIDIFNLRIEEQRITICYLLILIFFLRNQQMIYRKS